MSEYDNSFLSRELEEDIQIYKGVIRDALVEGLNDARVLMAIRDRLKPDSFNEAFLRYKGVGYDAIQTVVDEIQRRIDEEPVVVAQDIQRDVFDTKVFRVGIVVGDGPALLVEGVVAEGGRVLPIVDGEPYAGDIIDVIFDR